MKRGLMIQENDFLNMDQIVQWWFTDHSLNIATTLTDGDPIFIVTEKSGNVGRYTARVTVQELQRIKRELNEYMSASGPKPEPAVG